MIQWCLRKKAKDADFFSSILRLYMSLGSIFNFLCLKLASMCLIASFYEELQDWLTRQYFLLILFSQSIFSSIWLLVTCSGASPISVWVSTCPTSLSIYYFVIIIKFNSIFCNQIYIFYSLLCLIYIFLFTFSYFDCTLFKLEDSTIPMANFF